MSSASRPERIGRRGQRWRTVATLLVSYTAAILWHGRQRYLSAILAVACAAALINIQWGLVLGIYAGTSLPVDRSGADVWVGAPRLPSVDGGRRISTNHVARLARLPEVEHTEPLVIEYAPWVKPDGTRENCIVVGSRLGDDALGAVRDLTAEQRVLLAEPGAVVVDRADQGRLGVQASGDAAEVLGQRVRVVGWVDGLKGLNGPFVFCSLDTARQLLNMPPDQATYLLARCRTPAEAPAVTKALKGYSDLSAFTPAELSLRSRLFWLTKTPGGLATTCMAVLTLLVGAVVTSETLYTATVAALREYAVLRALGIPRWRIGTLVLCQSFGVGLIGVLLAVPLIALLDVVLGVTLGIRMLLPWWLMLGLLGVSMLMALAAGLATLRSLRLMDPNVLLR